MGSQRTLRNNLTVAPANNRLIEPDHLNHTRHPCRATAQSAILLTCRTDTERLIISLVVSSATRLVERTQRESLRKRSTWLG